MITGAAPDLAILIDAIVRRHGIAVLDEPRKLFALLRDYAPGAARDVRVAIMAVEAGITGRLDALLGPDAEAAIRSESSRMVDSFGCRPDLAEAAVRNWARASRSLADLRPGAAASPAPVPSVLPLPLPAAIAPIPVGVPLPALGPGADRGTAPAGLPSLWRALRSRPPLLWGLAAAALLLILGASLSALGFLP